MLNIYGMPLQKCSSDPLTGFLRNGCCQACDEDVGEHTICVEMTEEFLLFSKASGNDLITPQLQIASLDCCLATAGVFVYLDGSRPKTRA